jgi:Flp pilus assembly protein TadB
MIALAAALAAGLVLIALVQRGGNSDTAARSAEAFDRALEQETSAAARTMLRVARPLAASTAVNPEAESPLYRGIRLKIAAGGSVLFAGSVEVYLATQVACIILSMMVLTGVLVAGAGGMISGAGILFAAALAYWPYSRLHEASSKRTAEVNKALPEFAEMLLMPLNSGFGILAALEFTAQRSQGPVAREVRLLVDAIRTRTSTELQAFEDAADHLGTPAAKSFFTALAQAYIEGTKVAETISSQAEALRKAEYERLRETIKKVPNQIAIILGLHLLPSLFLITLFPAFASLATF